MISQKRWFVPSLNPTRSVCPAGGGDESLNVTSDIVAPGPTGDATVSGSCDSSGGVDPGPLAGVDFLRRRGRRRCFEPSWIGLDLLGNAERRPGPRWRE